MKRIMRIMLSAIAMLTLVACSSGQTLSEGKYRDAYIEIETEYKEMMGNVLQAKTTSANATDPTTIFNFEWIKDHEKEVASLLSKIESFKEKKIKGDAATNRSDAVIKYMDVYFGDLKFAYENRNATTAEVTTLFYEYQLAKQQQFNAISKQDFEALATLGLYSA